MQSRSANNIQGIDISHYQSDIDIQAAAKQGIKIVYLKATEGEHTTDPAFKDLYSKVRAAGLKVGAYHFFHAGGNYTVNKQTENFCTAIEGMSLDCLPTVDIEDGGYHGGTPGEITAQIIAFVDEVKAKTGLDCAVYSNTNFIKEHLLAESDKLEKLNLWVAHYGVNTPGENGIWQDWTGFQFSENGNVGGCLTDLDEFTSDILISPVKVGIDTLADYTKWPGTEKLRLRANNPFVTAMGKQLIKLGFGTHYSIGAGPEFTEADRQNYREFQLACGYTGANADGFPGPASWVRLMSGKKIISAYPGPEFFRIGVASAFTPIAEQALIKAGCNYFKSVGNPWGDGDIRSYKAFQKKIGDKTGDGIPGPWGWTKLQKYM